MQNTANMARGRTPCRAEKPAMTAAVLALVLTAAVLHAAWNVLAKCAQPASPTAFVWLCSALSAVALVPAVIVLLIVAPPRHPFTLVDAAFVAVTAIFHITYFVLLQRGYRDGDLSLVYPLARGTGPLIASIVAVAIFRERPGVLGAAGIALIVGGIFLATGPTLRSPRVRVSTAYGFATGAAIAAYTLWDKEAVSALAIAPILYDFGRNALQAVVMAPFVWTASRRRAALDTWNAVAAKPRASQSFRRCHTFSFSSRSLRHRSASWHRYARSASSSERPSGPACSTKAMAYSASLPRS